MHYFKQLYACVCPCFVAKLIINKNTVLYVPQFICACAVEFMSVIEALRLITIKVKSRSKVSNHAPDSASDKPAKV